MTLANKNVYDSNFTDAELRFGEIEAERLPHHKHHKTALFTNLACEVASATHSIKGGQFHLNLLFYLTGMITWGVMVSYGRLKPQVTQNVCRTFIVG